MSNSVDNMDEQEKEIAQLSEDINPREDKSPDSLAEATTAPLEDDELGGNAKENDVKQQMNSNFARQTIRLTSIMKNCCQFSGFLL